MEGLYGRARERILNGGRDAASESAGPACHREQVPTSPRPSRLGPAGPARLGVPVALAPSTAQAAGAFGGRCLGGRVARSSARRGAGRSRRLPARAACLAAQPAAHAGVRRRLRAGRDPLVRVAPPGDRLRTARRRTAPAAAAGRRRRHRAGGAAAVRAGTVIASRWNDSALPCMSRLSESFTPPSSTSSSTKFIAPSRGSR